MCEEKVQCQAVHRTPYKARKDDNDESSGKAWKWRKRQSQSLLSNSRCSHSQRALIVLQQPANNRVAYLDRFHHDLV